jgi:hypothetical protein
MSQEEKEREKLRAEDKARWEFSKKLTMLFLVFFAIHLVSLLSSAILSLGDYTMIKDSFLSSLPFYGVIFTGYTAKATFENYDKFRKQYELANKKIDAQTDCEESDGRIG